MKDQLAEQRRDGHHAALDRRVWQCGTHDVHGAHRDRRDHVHLVLDLGRDPDRATRRDDPCSALGRDAHHARCRVHDLPEQVGVAPRARSLREVQREDRHRTLRYDPRLSSSRHRLAAYGKPRARRVVMLERMPLALALLAVVAFAGGCMTNPARNEPMHPPPHASVLHPAEMVGFCVTTDGVRCRAFYEGRLGFRLISEDGFALVFDADGRMLRIQKQKSHEPRPYTVLGWNVVDLEATLARMQAAGVNCERFAGVPQDDKGIMNFPDGTRLAWFKDPDGNVLSVAQMPR